MPTVTYLLHQEASRESDCLPDPPTPTSRACPDSLITMREIFAVCLQASSNKTRSIIALQSF
jgi:hypothetical protein